MDFRLSSEQEMLRDSARCYFVGEGSFEQRRAAKENAVDEWTRFAEFGWLAMPIEERFEGLGASFEDITILCEEMGRGLAQAPFIGASILPARLLARCGESVTRDDLLLALARNSARIGVAIHEPDRRYRLDPVTRVAASPAGIFQLSGFKTLVSGGAQADRLIVSARQDVTGDEPVLFVVETNQPGVQRHVYTALDGAEMADFTFDAVALPADARLSASHGAIATIEDALDEATLCLCADMLGSMEQAIALTASYLKVRKQFGKPLSDFQVLQHAVAEMAIDAGSARSMVYRALSALGLPRQERQRAISACAIKLMQTAKPLTGMAVHLHGGIGMTCEYPVGHYLRRVVVAERLFGDREHHLARYLGS